jgi:hypothetical protein
MFLLFSKQNKSRYQYWGLFVVSVSILKGVVVKSELLPTCRIYCNRKAIFYALEYTINAISGRVAF